LEYNAINQDINGYRMNAIFKLDSLRKKIFLYIIVVIVLCAVVSTFMINLVVEYQMAGQYRAEKEAAIESLSYSLSPMLEAHDYQQITQLLSASLSFDNIAFVAVSDGNGTLIGSVIKENVAAADIQKESHDIKSNGTTTGSFEIGFSQKYIDDLVRRTTLILIISLVVFLFLAGLALFIFLGRSVVQPIEIFARTILKIGPDNLSIRIGINTEDEIGVLASNFNNMAGELEKSYSQLQSARDELEQKVEQRTRGERRRAEQLRAINEVSRRISAILSLDELLPYVVSSLQATFNYYNVNLFLVDRDLDGVILKAQAGGDKAASPIGCLVRMDEGVVGCVAGTGEPFNASDVNPESGNIGYRELSATRSELAVPIKIGAETLGVLDIQSIETGAFDEIDLFTAQTLGDQLAVAIENARLYQESRDIAVLEERNRMAREIHDTLAQGFTGIILQLEAAEQSLGEDTDHAQEHLNRARQLARESLNEARRSVWALRPQELERLPFMTALRQQTDRFYQDTGIQTELNISPNEKTLSAEIENALLRIFQESLTNIKKHAQAGKVEIKLTFDDKLVMLRIDDNGVGFDPASSMENRFGLISMRERAKLLGGSVDVRSEQGQGTHIEVTMPVDRGAI
jgi:signal transduction histidine kinase